MNFEKTATYLLAATVALNLTACGVGEAKIASPEGQEAVTLLPVEVSSPVKADIFATYHTTTTITSDAEAVVLARVGGEVEEILVEEGDHVHAGQVLARLDGDRLRLRMQQAKARLDKVSKEYERFVRLQEKGLVSTSDIESLKYDMDALAAAYELKRLDYRYTFIRAPISGIVAARVVKVGQHVDVNEATFRITDRNRLVAILRIPQTELEKFSVGDLAKVQVDAMPELSFEARIARISPTIDMRNGTFRATAYMKNEDGLLAPGMFGRFDIAYEQHADALLVPVDALVNEDNQVVVYVVEDGAAVRRVIQTGIKSGDDIEVLSGLSEHEQIVVTGQGSLRDGSRVVASIDTEGPVTG
jgi:membrane fusion protein (multidrug efflux system)